MAAALRDTRSVVLVDANDEPIGVEGLLASHSLQGRKHRAFTAVVLDAGGRIVLARRAAGKLLWCGHWDGTVASHPRPGEEYVQAGERRVLEELGVECELHRFGRFDYRVAFRDVGTEDEVCATLVGRLAAGDEPAPDPREIDAIRALDPLALVAELTHDPDSFCPWLYLALICAGAPSSAATGGPPAELDDWLAPLRAAEVQRALRGGLIAHLPDGAWRLLDEQSGGS